MPLTYGKYLHLDDLLAAQEPLSDGPEHDELLFIVIHQVYELWFKQILHELDRLTRMLELANTHHALAGLKRILTIMKTLVGQVDILETMTPTSFGSFRARLATASGFESAQFRMVEFVLGYKREAALLHYPEGSPERALLATRMAERTLWDAFARYLQRLGYAVPQAVLARDVREQVAPNEAMQAVLLSIYRSDALTAQVCERLVDLDEGLQEWRYRHVKMVERTIGEKTGSGGSSGAQYLRSTLFRPLFPDLWAIRGQL